jgi:hypothetical protein
MQKRFAQTIISFLVIFLLAPGSFAGKRQACLQDCPHCKVLTECCGKAAHPPGDERGSRKHLKVSVGCSHSEMCPGATVPPGLALPAGNGADGASVWVAARHVTPVNYPRKIKYHLPLVPDFLSGSPPLLFLRNCSFLI